MAFEDRLRQSLASRATDVEPDPATWDRVQSRIRRGRILRAALAGAGGLAVVALAFVMVPALTNRTIEFEPAAPPAVQPTEPTAMPSPSPTAPPTEPYAPTRPATPGVVNHVDVYFTREGAECGEDTVAHQRTVEGAGVLRGALAHLLLGPTPQEQGDGARTVFPEGIGDVLNDVTINDGVARIDFAYFADRMQVTSCTTMALLAQLDATATQFPSVSRAIYSFDGSVKDFYLAFELAPPDSDEPGAPAAVRQKAEQIRLAAEAGSYRRLEALMPEDFSCTFSDQPEPCRPYWRDLERRGEDPLGTLADLLTRPATRDGDSDMWVWPAAWAEPGAQYNGPRTGIAADGTWRYYVAEPGG